MDLRPKYQLCLHFLLVVGCLDKFTTNGCSHFHFVHLSWQCIRLSMIIWPTRLMLSMYSEIGYALANNWPNCAFCVLFTFGLAFGAVLSIVLWWGTCTFPLFLDAVFYEVSKSPSIYIYRKKLYQKHTILELTSLPWWNLLLSRDRPFRFFVEVWLKESNLQLTLTLMCVQLFRLIWLQFNDISAKVSSIF